MKTNLLLAACVGLFSLSIKSQCSFGSYPPNYTMNGGWTNGAWLAKKFNLASTATLTGLGLNSAANSSTQYKMAIYTDVSNAPGNLVSVTAQGIIGLGQNTLSVPAVTAIPAGDYWIMAIYNGSGPTTYSNSTTPLLQQNGSMSSPPANLSSWVVGSNYNVDYWAIINTPQIAINGPTATCSGNSITYTATGATAYVWNSSAPLTNTVTFTPSANGTYTVTGVSQSGCPASASISFTVNPLPALSITGNNTVCAGSSLNQTVTGATSFTWGTGPVSNTISLSPATTTVYAVSGTDSNGCIGSTNSSITVYALPVLSITGSTAVCLGTSVTQTVTGALTYTWSGGAMANTATFSPVTNTVYTATGTDANGCISSVNSSITVNGLPSLNPVLSKPVICSGETGTITISGVTTCTWDNGPTGLTLVVSPTVTSTYTATGTDANSCVNSTTVTQAVDLCTSIAKHADGDMSAVAVPNPGNGIFEIRLNNTTNTSITLTIFNSTGMFLTTEKISQHPAEIDLSRYANGLYYLIVQSTENRSVIKLVKE